MEPLRGVLDRGDEDPPNPLLEQGLQQLARPHGVPAAAFYRSLVLLTQAAVELGTAEDAQELAALRDRVTSAFLEHYVSALGVVTSDCPTVYALAIAFDLLDGERLATAGRRLADLVAEGGYRIATGFAGTPFILDALTRTGQLDVAYRLLLQRECPSWLYPITMGATTVWERWDSMLPDGSVNAGEMTSFNHYALGAVADWMHRTIGGIAPLAPGYAQVLVAPEPGGGITWARAALDTPHGRIATHWEAHVDGGIDLTLDVPDGVTATVRLPGGRRTVVGLGRHILGGSSRRAEPESS